MTQERKKTWAEMEFGSAELGDNRLTNRLISIADTLAQNPTASIPQACGSWSSTKATYRFLDNKKVKFPDILNPHYDATKERAKNHNTLLAIQDTTYLDFTNHPATKGLGILCDTSHKGLIYHPTLLVTPDKVPLGIIDHQVWKRNLKDFGKRHKRKSLPLSKKESKKWLNSLQSTAQLQKENPNLHIINVADREADIYDFFKEAITLKHDVLVRAAWNRRLNYSNPEKYLWDYMKKVQSKGSVTITVPRKNNQPPREATLSIRYHEVFIMPPSHRCKKEGLKPLKLWAVWAHEDLPPRNVEAISWMLITTIPVSSFEVALKMVEWYTCRWQIEIFNKILKSGCKLESLQLEEADRLKRCLALYSVIAWRVLFLTMVSRATPQIPCDVLLTLEEWQALYCFSHKTKKPPLKPPTLIEATLMIAKLGGFLGRKNDKHPGPTVIWRGLQRLGDIAIAFSLARSP